jgi:hypothetical protein
MIAMVCLRASLRPEFPTWAHFLRCFCRTEEQVIQCIEILQAIINSENALPDKEWERIPKTSSGMYTKCAAILRSNGLVVKHNGYYSLSRDIIHVLEKVEDRWKELVNAVEKGEKIRIK